MEDVIEVAKQYVNAFKEVNPGLVRKYFSPKATKTGCFYDFEKNEWGDILSHSYQEIIEWTRSYNSSGVMPDTEIQATLLDMQDKIAVVKIIAQWAPDVWGYDYITLVKEKQGWIISAILWQSMIS